MAQSGGITLRHALRFAWSVYGFAAAMAFMAIVPGCNSAYSGHGGFAWFIAPLVFPYALIRMSWIYSAASRVQRNSILLLACITLVAYVPLSLIATYVGARSIESSFGLQIKPLELWGMFTMPFGLIMI
jgi:hypothetical protein